MLSKYALFILGMVAAGPINPYAINKIVNLKLTNTRPKIPTPTIYGIIKMLDKKKYISGKKAKNGKMPDMTIYSITPKGEEVLKKNLTYYMTTPEENLSDLSLSIFLMGHLDRTEVLRGLKEYRDKIETEIVNRKRMIAKDRACGVSYAGMLVINHVLQIFELKLKTVDALIAEIEADKEWRRGPIPFWRDQIPAKPEELANVN